MKIKITKENECKVEEALEKAVGKARAHTHSVVEIFDTAEYAEKELEKLGVPKKMRSGVIVFDQGGGPGKAYARKSYFVNASNITLTRGSKDWFLTDVEKVQVSADGAAQYALYVDQDVVNHGLSNKNIVVRKAA